MEFDSDAIRDTLIEVITEIAPDAVLVNRYGGLVFEAQAGVHRSIFCGIFEFTAHVGLEFNRGAQLGDPDGLLEGNGRYRKHIKLRSVEDIAARGVAGFVAQAYALVAALERDS